MAKLGNLGLKGLKDRSKCLNY